MSWLFIDTHVSGQYRVGWLGEKISVKTGIGRSHRLLVKLPPIARLKREIEGVCVVNGPGSFSSVRTGVLYANVLSRVLRVPLIGISVGQAQNLNAVSALLDASRAVEYVSPVYDAEPNITLPRS